jgi:hypothetical protein
MGAIAPARWRCGWWCVVRLSSIVGALAAADGQRCATLAGGAAGGTLVPCAGSRWRPAVRYTCWRCGWWHTGALAASGGQRGWRWGGWVIFYHHSDMEMHQPFFVTRGTLGPYIQGLHWVLLPY